MERLTIDVGAIVQHFHRNKWLASATEEEREKAPYTYLYRIESVAYWQENVRGCGLMVVYRALYNEMTYVRTIEDFLCKVNEEDCGQGYRFVRYEGKIEWDFKTE